MCSSDLRDPKLGKIVVIPSPELPTSPTPTSLPSRMAPLSPLDSTIPQQLAPTMGQEMSGVTFWAGSTGGVRDTIAVGLVSYYDETDTGYVFNDSFWTLAKENPAGWSTVSIGGFDIFVGFTAEALDSLDFNSSMPATHPSNMEAGLDLDSSELSDLDFGFDADDEDDYATSFNERQRRSSTLSASLEDPARKSRAVNLSLSCLLCGLELIQKPDPRTLLLWSKT